MSELITGKEALIALANGEEVECKNDVTGMDWSDATGLLVRSFFDPTHMWGFRLKPRTITLNNIEIPAPFEPKDSDDCRCYYINTALKSGFDWYHSTHHESRRVAWRTEEEIKQVVSALCSVFRGGAE